MGCSPGGPLGKLDRAQVGFRVEGFKVEGPCRAAGATFSIMAISGTGISVHYHLSYSLNS